MPVLSLLLHRHVTSLPRLRPLQGDSGAAMCAEQALAEMLRDKSIISILEHAVRERVTKRHGAGAS